MTQENKQKATIAALAATGATALAAESYIYLIAKIKQKNGGTFKLMDAVDIDWTGFDWSTAGIPTFSLTPATADKLGGVKIGANVTAATDGTISVTADNVKAALGFTPAEGDDTGSAKNALQLGGHSADYFASKDAMEAAVSATTWKAAVTDAVALKAVKAPVDTETRALLDTNAIYQFNDSSTATADNAPNVYVPADGTKGAWVLLSHLVYSPATQTADGLMSSADKKKLDGMQALLDGKVDKEGYVAYSDDEKTKLAGLLNIKALGAGVLLDEKTGTLTGTVADLTPYAKTADMNTALAGKVDKAGYVAYSQAEKDKLAGLTQASSTFFATVDIGSDTDVNQSDIVIPDGVTIKVGDNVIDNQGGQYVITKVTPASGSGDTAVAASVHVSAVGLQLALKSSIDSLAKIKKVGSGLTLAADGTLTANVQSVDLSEYQKTADADAKYETQTHAAATYATKGDVDVVSEDFITGLFA